MYLPKPKSTLFLSNLYFSALIMLTEDRRFSDSTVDDVVVDIDACKLSNKSPSSISVLGPLPKKPLSIAKFTKFSNFAFSCSDSSLSSKSSSSSLSSSSSSY